MEFRHKPISAARWALNLSILVIPLGLLSIWWPALLDMIVMSALFALVMMPFANRLVKQTRLVLETDGLRYLKPGFEISLRWNEVVALRPVWRWGIRGLELHKRKGGYLLLANFEEMDEITRYVEMHITPQENLAVRHAVILRSYGRVLIWSLLTVGGLSLLIGQGQHGHGGLETIGLILLVLGGLGFKVAMPLNTLRRR
ncbi:MAG TPA: hypothetical protein VGH91_12895 [Gammaproteobacteria bacterium]|jgi:hypothetical protein